MMNEWPPYVGVVTGIVGMITGVTGACLGYLGYRRSGRVKALDLRLELRKAGSPRTASGAHQSSASVKDFRSRLGR